MTDGTSLTEAYGSIRPWFTPGQKAKYSVRASDRARDLLVRMVADKVRKPPPGVGLEVRVSDHHIASGRELISVWIENCLTRRFSVEVTEEFKELLACEVAEILAMGEAIPPNPPVLI